mgnify:CR=1 FL=1
MYRQLCLIKVLHTLVSDMEKGDDKALEAVKEAVSSPLLETTIAGASHVIINISGDITLMDASDAAEYVQELAGEEANIIFGAMYDDTKTDEATITVIATGLHNTGGTASKLKARLEKAVMPTIQNVEQPEVSVNQQAVNKELGAGVANSAQQKVAGGTMPTLQVPRTPTSHVKEQSIKIPSLFGKNKRLKSEKRYARACLLFLSNEWGEVSKHI